MLDTAECCLTHISVIRVARHGTWQSSVELGQLPLLVRRRTVEVGGVWQRAGQPGPGHHLDQSCGGGGWHPRQQRGAADWQTWWQARQSPCSAH